MKILLCHNYYQRPGGEDVCFAEETRLLEQHGHEVVRYVQHNSAIDDLGVLQTARKGIWNRQTYGALRELMRRERPQVMHCTNTFPLISPAAYYAAKAEGVAVVQALHNYRLLCPNALFLRNQKVCEDCLGKFVPWPAVLHGCYRNDRGASAAVAAMLVMHKLWRTYRRTVDRFYALTEFGRQKFIQGGLPAEKLSVKPNFMLAERGPGAGDGGYLLFVGRLSQEKGVSTLLEAWRQSPPAGVRLKIAGDGPLADDVRRAAAACDTIDYVGQVSSKQVCDLVAAAQALVLPSIWYECFPRTIVESFAMGTPVIASRLGGMAELIRPGETGLHFAPSNAADLAKCLRQIQHADLRAAMRVAAYREYAENYTPECNYGQLMEIYRLAIEESQRHLPSAVRSAAAKAAALEHHNFAADKNAVGVGTH